MTTCNKADPESPLRCELERGNHEKHSASGISESGGYVREWPNADYKEGPRRRIRSRPRAVSEKQQADTDVVTGIMAERVHKNFETFSTFECECALANGSDSDRGPHLWCGRFEKNPQDVLDNWHPHHIEKRRNGPKANRHNVFRSRSRPENIAIVHPECHRRIEGSEPWA